MTARVARSKSPWTEADIGDLKGCTAIVTGANSGIGFHTALQLAVHGAHVVMATRDTQRGEEAARQIIEVYPNADLEVQVLDLADLSSVRRFATAWIQDHRQINILVNNAGVMGIPPSRRTVEGFETQFGINHLGHFTLTGLLLPSLLAHSGARVVTVSSGGAAIGQIDFDNLQGERRYRLLGTYTQSKLANLIFALELDQRARAGCTDLVSVACHPGIGATKIGMAERQQSKPRRLQDIALLGLRLVAQPAAQAALPSLYAATSATVSGGEYFGPANFYGLHGPPTRITPPRQALDSETARRLWEVSEELTGVRYNLLTQRQIEKIE